MCKSFPTHKKYFEVQNKWNANASMDKKDVLELDLFTYWRKLKFWLRHKLKISLHSGMKLYLVTSSRQHSIPAILKLIIAIMKSYLVICSYCFKRTLAVSESVRKLGA